MKTSNVGTLHMKSISPLLALKGRGQHRQVPSILERMGKHKDEHHSDYILNEFYLFQFWVYFSWQEGCQI